MREASLPRHLIWSYLFDAFTIEYTDTKLSIKSLKFTLPLAVSHQLPQTGRASGNICHPGLRISLEVAACAYGIDSTPSHNVTVIDTLMFAVRCSTYSEYSPYSYHIEYLTYCYWIEVVVWRSSSEGSGLTSHMRFPFLFFISLIIQCVKWPTAWNCLFVTLPCSRWVRRRSCCWSSLWVPIWCPPARTPPALPWESAGWRSAAASRSQSWCRTAQTRFSIL